MDLRKLLAELIAERERVDAVIAALEPLGANGNLGGRQKGKLLSNAAGRKRRLSAAARKRMSEAARKMWVRRRKAAAGNSEVKAGRKNAGKHAASARA